MTQDFPALGLILLFPALGVVFNLFCGRRLGRGAVNFVGPAVIFAAFAVTLWGFIVLLGLPPGASLQCKLWTIGALGHTFNPSRQSIEIISVNNTAGHHKLAFEEQGS